MDEDDEVVVDPEEVAAVVTAIVCNWPARCEPILGSVVVFLEYDGTSCRSV